MLNGEIKMIFKTIYAHNEFIRFMREQSGYLLYFNNLLLALGLEMNVGVGLLNFFFNHLDEVETSLQYQESKEFKRLNFFLPNIRGISFVNVYLSLFPSFSAYREKYAEWEFGIKFNFIWMLMFFLNLIHNFKYFNLTKKFYTAKFIPQLFL
jgi:hypothetical protein